MRRLVLALSVVIAASLVAVPAGAQIQMPYSVVGCGGGVMSGASHIIHGTVGQAVIGVVSGPNHTNEIGFWYRPGWILTGIEGDDVLPTRNWLDQNHPNPFNPLTTLTFAVVDRCDVIVKLYDVAGREVATLVDDQLDPGYHRTVIDGSDLASGVYFARMVAGSFTASRKMVLLK